VHCAAAGARLDGRGSAVGDDVPALDDQDPVGDRIGLLKVMRGEHHRPPPGGERANLPPEASPRVHVKARGRFIEEEQLPGPR